MPRIRAFTLLEVLIALLVVGIAVAALARAGGQVTGAQIEIEQRTLALWVADNVISEMRLERSVDIGRRQGSNAMGGRDWHWEALVEVAPGGEMLRVDVHVHADRRGDRPILVHTGFLPL